MLCDLRDMIEGAKRDGFALPCFDVPDLALATAAMEAAADMDSPVVLHPTRDTALLMPALGALTRLAPVPCAMVLTNIADRGDAAEAIRLGAAGLALAAADHPHLQDMADACAVALLDTPGRTADRGTPAPGFGWLGGELADATGIPVARRQSEAGRSVPWEDLIDIAHKAARGRAADAIGRCGSAGWGEMLASRCRVRREVDHVVLYNAEGETAEMVAEGMRALSAVPGVRQIFAGRALVSDARYGHAWVVRFVDTGVIDWYRDHPLHTRFADTYFRPVAGDRVTIDFSDET